jgi:lipoprotein-releasing system permease protein
MLQRAITTDYTSCSGYEILLSDFDKIDASQLQISEIIGYQFQAKSVKETYFSMFQWLKIVDTNVLIIVFLMLAVAGINVVTMLLIMVIDRIRMIGILKSMGAVDRQISSIFKWQGFYILAIGLGLGNLFGLGFGYLQSSFKLLKLSAETYYMDAVPYYLPWSYVLFINIGFIIITFLFISFPVLLVNKIKPTEILRFS